MPTELGLSTSKGFQEKVPKAKKADSATNAANATNATKVNNLEITRDSNGILKIGNVVIPQRKLLSNNRVAIPTVSGLVYNIGDPIFGKTLEFVVSNGACNYFHKATVGAIYEQYGGTTLNLVIDLENYSEPSFQRIINFTWDSEAIYARATNDDCVLEEIWEVIE